MNIAVRQLVTDLIAKGLDPVDAADFVARASVILAAAKGDATAERRRAYDRERKAAERASAKSTGFPPDKADRDICITNSIQLDKKDISPSPQSPVDKADKLFKYPTEFEEIWALFVKRVGKDAAFRQWKKAKQRVSHETLIAAVRAQAAKDRAADIQFVPHPATWLSEGRWQDEGLLPQEPRAAQSEGYWVAYGTDAGDAWERHFRARGRIPPRDSKGGWTHPSEWPPEQELSAA